MNFTGDINEIIKAAKHTLYQDLLCGVFDKQYEDIDLKGHYGKMYRRLSESYKNGKREDLKKITEEIR